MGEPQLPRPLSGPVMGLYRDYFTFVIVYSPENDKIVSECVAIIKYIICTSSV
jgi:hypothetical protein